MQAKRIRQLVLVLFFLVLPALFLRAHIKDPNQHNAFDHVLLRVSGPVQRVFSWAARGIKDVVLRYVVLVNAKHENERLAEENGKLRAQIQSNNANMERIRRLEALLSIKETWRDQAIQAEVVQLDAFPTPNRAITIRLAEHSSAVEPGMPVIVPAGIIGKILYVTGAYAKVQLITDPSFTLAVQIPRVHRKGLLRGRGAQLPIAVELLASQDTIQVGDVVTTMGIGTPESGGVVPADLTVGVVTEIPKSFAGPHQQISISSVMARDSLREVLVLLAPQPPAGLLLRSSSRGSSSPTNSTSPGGR